MSFSQDALEKASNLVKSAMGGVFLGPTGVPKSFNDRKMLQTGRQLRQKGLWELPILPGAITTFQDIASGREWMVSGKESNVMRAVECFNLSQSVDPSTGMVDVGFESFIRRRVIDALVVGRTAYHFQTYADGPPVLEYIDPTLLYWDRDKDKEGPVRPSERVWKYSKRKTKIPFADITTHHLVPFGPSGFISKIFPILPTAALAWLVREHNSSSLDGRKIRDIIFVSNPSFQNALKEAIAIQAALYSGGSDLVDDVPVVEVTNPTGKPLTDLITTLGLSQIPTGFKEEEFTFMYVNEIASNLGLALRHFWNNERTTNRALEIVQEQRQQLKGPSSFVRAEQRLYNRLGGIMDAFSTPRSRTRFGFIEEVDSASAKDHATILKETAEALEKISSVFGATIDLQSYLAWMQSLRALPNDLRLVEGPSEIQVQDSDSLYAENGDITQDGDPEPNSFEEAAAKLFEFPDIPKLPYYLDYDEISVNQYGHVVDRRVKVFTVEGLMESKVRKDVKGTDEDSYENSVKQARETAVNLFHKVFHEVQDRVNQWVATPNGYSQGLKRKVLDRTLDRDTKSFGDVEWGVFLEMMGEIIHD